MLSVYCIRPVSQLRVTTRIANYHEEKITPWKSDAPFVENPIVLFLKAPGNPFVFLKSRTSNSDDNAPSPLSIFICLKQLLCCKLHRSKNLCKHGIQIEIT